MRFRITADAEFEAENIDDAFLKLEAHFTALQDDEMDDTLEFIGEIEVKKIEETV